MKGVFAAFIMFVVSIVSYSQNSEECELITESGKLYGSLLLPSTTKKVPLVLIISGSGPTDRDGNNPFMKNNSLKMLATELSRNDIASFRFDKRGVGKSKEATLNEADLRFETYVDDVEDWIALFKKDSRFSNVYVLGHSEGSLLGMLAAQELSVKGYISVAGLGRPASEVIREQLQKQSMQLAGMAEPVLTGLEKGELSDSIPPLLNSLLRPSVQPYLISWFNYDPCEEIQKVSCPVLLVQGTNDLQVPVRDAELLKEASPSANLKIIQGMNHIFKFTSDDRIENLQSYHNPELPIYIGLVNVIVQFIGS